MAASGGHQTGGDRSSAFFEVKSLGYAAEVIGGKRIPSAHPRIMRLAQAQKCKETMPERIDYLIDSVESGLRP